MSAIRRQADIFLGAKNEPDKSNEMDYAKLKQQVAFNRPGVQWRFISAITWKA